MIAQNFAYCRPETLADLGEAFARFPGAETLPLAGGTEILSMARVGSMLPKAVVDLKAIAETRQQTTEHARLHLGATLTLHELQANAAYPLLAQTAARIADHTSQCRITLGGNLCGTIAYREAALPLLLADADARVWSQGNVVQMPLAQAFQKRAQRGPNDVFLSFSLPVEATRWPFIHVKKTRGAKIQYPLATLCAVRTPQGARLALSGVCAYPFRDARLDAIFGDATQTPQTRACAILDTLPQPVMSDAFATAAYRAHVLRNMLEDAMRRLDAPGKEANP